MVCPFCGKEIYGDGLFCAACDEALSRMTVTVTAVAEPPDGGWLDGGLPDGEPLPSRPAETAGKPARRRERTLFLYVMTALCALSLTALALVAGAFYDTLDPLQLRDVLWPDGEEPVPPSPGGLASPDGPSSGLTPPVYPVSRGKPLGDERENAVRLLRASVSLGVGVSPEVPPGDGVLTDFLWQALRCAGPEGRFEEMPDGYLLDREDLGDLCREALGFDLPALFTDLPALAAVDGGFAWRDANIVDWRVDVYDWQAQADGSVRVAFNILYAGMLYDSFVRKGEALLSPNGDPVYFRYRLASLSWIEPGRFKPARIAASSSLRGGGAESFLPDKLVDGDPATAWMADAPGDGTGQWLELAFDRRREITGLTLVNGYAKDLKSLRDNNRVRDIRVECGGYAHEFTLEDALDYLTEGEYQSLTFGKAVTADTITITILSVYEGDAAAGVRHTALGEIEVF